MRIVSFNINGIRAIGRKSKNKQPCNFEENSLNSLIKELNPDFLCLQEIRTSDSSHLEGYDYPYVYVNFASKKGYSGTAIYSRTKALSFYKNFDAFEDISNECDQEKWSSEGRVCTLVYEKFILVNVYVPNAGSGMTRRMLWDFTFSIYCEMLSKIKPIIVCGDMNCAHEAIDTYCPDPEMISFTPFEREGLSKLILDSNLVDIYRVLNPDKIRYTFWSNFFKSRSNNGIRLDYFLVSKSLTPQILDSDTHPEYYGSDHCPISLTFSENINALGNSK